MGEEGMGATRMETRGQLCGIILSPLGSRNQTLLVKPGGKQPEPHILEKDLDPQDEEWKTEDPFY